MPGWWSQPHSAALSAAADDVVLQAHIRRCTGGSRDAALADFEAVHAQLRGTLGRSHPKTLAAAMNIGVLLLKGVRPSPHPHPIPTPLIILN